MMFGILRKAIAPRTYRVHVWLVGRAGQTYCPIKGLYPVNRVWNLKVEQVCGGWNKLLLLLFYAR